MTSHTTLAQPTIPFQNLAEQMPAKTKRKLNIPEDAPDLLDAMLRTTAMHLDAGNVVDEEKARKDVGWAWANWNANRGDRRYATLVDIALLFPKEDGIPPVMVHPSFRPETVVESAMRLLRLVKQRTPFRLSFLIDQVLRARLLTESELKRL